MGGFGFAETCPLPLLPWLSHRQREITTFAFAALDLLTCPRALASLPGASKQIWSAAAVARRAGLFAFTGKPVY